MSNLVRLAPGVLTVGKPLPWKVFDEKGNLLLVQGYVIQTESQLETLYRRGLFYQQIPASRIEEEPSEPEPRRFSPFAEYAGLLQRLEETLSAISTQSDQAARKLEWLARHIDAICVSDPDAALALVHIYSIEPTAYEQTLFYAILCRAAAQRLDFDTERRHRLLMAALTANLALLPHQDKLNQSRLTLNDQQRAVIERHPELSADALAKAGIVHERCLKIVRQHHERFDGSGYPSGLKGKDILPEAKLLSLSERYTAMITKRAYRQRCRPDQAMADILNIVKAAPEPEIYHAFFKELSLYPPGTLVKLANREVAVVTHRGSRENTPLAQAIVSPKGNPYLGSFARDTQQEEYRIEQILMPDILPPLNLASMWGYG